MNKSRFPANSYIGTTELKSVSEFIEDNIHTLLNGIADPGLIIKKLANGALDESFKVTTTLLRDNTIDLIVKPGFFIRSVGQKTKIIEFKGKTFTLDGVNYLPGNYNVILIPGVSSYEAGTLTFTQDSDIVTIANGTFQHVRPYGYLIIEDQDASTGTGNAFQVNAVSDTTVTLVETYRGSTMANIKWKAGARFPSNAVPSGNEEKVIYDYDSCDVYITPKPYSGYKLADITISSPLKVNIADTRSQSLAVFKNNAANADDVRSGADKNITTIEEKAQASALSYIVNDFNLPGIRGSYSFTKESTGTLKISAFTAYNGEGKRIYVPQQNLNLFSYIGPGKIKSGTNKLYVKYVSPNSYELIWNLLERGDAEVYLGRVDYNPLETPGNQFTIYSDYVYRNRIKCNSLVTEGRAITNPLDGTWTEGEIFYSSTERVYYYIRKKIDSNALEAVKLVNMDILTEQINALKFTEKLRFTFYPYADKNNWFFFNGIGAPCPIGYPFAVQSWKIGVLDTINFDETNYHSATDYISKLQNNPKVVSETTLWRYVQNRITSAVDGKLLSKKPMPVNYPIGIYFNGTQNDNMIELIAGGNVLDKINMGGVIGSGGDTIPYSPLNTLYTAEVTIQQNTGGYYEEQED